MTDTPSTWSGRVARFAAVGVANTGLFLLVHLVFRLALPATAASVAATAVTTITGTIANGRVTFGVTGPIGLRGHLRSLAVTGLGLVITSGAVGVADTGGDAVDEVAVLVAASAVAGVLRFVLMGRWVFAPAAGGRVVPDGGGPGRAHPPPHGTTCAVGSPAPSADHGRSAARGSGGRGRALRQGRSRGPAADAGRRRTHGSSSRWIVVARGGPAATRTSVLGRRWAFLVFHLNPQLGTAIP